MLGCTGYIVTGYICTGYICTGYICTGYICTRYICTGYICTGYICTVYIYTGYICTGYICTGYISEEAYQAVYYCTLTEYSSRLDLHEYHVYVSNPNLHWLLVTHPGELILKVGRIVRGDYERIWAFFLSTSLMIE